MPTNSSAGDGISFGDDPDTGIYTTSTGVVGIATGGVGQPLGQIIGGSDTIIGNPIPPPGLGTHTIPANLGPSIFVEQEIAVFSHPLPEEGSIRWHKELNCAQISIGGEWKFLVSAEMLRDIYAENEKQAKEELPEIPSRFAMVAMDLEDVEYDSPEEIIKKKELQLAVKRTEQAVKDSVTNYLTSLENAYGPVLT